VHKGCIPTSNFRKNERNIRIKLSFLDSSRQFYSVFSSNFLKISWRVAALMDEPPLIIIQEETVSECRLCEQHEETIDHITSGHTILDKNGYLKETKQNWYTSALFNMQSTRHRKEKKMARARMHTHVLANTRARTHTHTHTKPVCEHTT